MLKNKYNIYQAILVKGQLVTDLRTRFDRVPSDYCRTNSIFSFVMHRKMVFMSVKRLLLYRIVNWKSILLFDETIKIEILHIISMWGLIWTNTYASVLRADALIGYRLSSRNRSFGRRELFVLSLSSLAQCLYRSRQRFRPGGRHNGNWRSLVLHNGVKWGQLVIMEAFKRSYWICIWKTFTDSSVRFRWVLLYFF